MKVNKVSAFPVKRRLHPAERDAGPQGVELTPQITVERKTDAMKTYILRGLEAVEAEKINRSAPPQTRRALDLW